MAREPDCTVNAFLLTEPQRINSPLDSGRNHPDLPVPADDRNHPHHPPLSSLHPVHHCKVHHESGADLLLLSDHEHLLPHQPRARTDVDQHQENGKTYHDNLWIQILVF